jgi:hypothetical protein
LGLGALGKTDEVREPAGKGDLDNDRFSNPRAKEILEKGKPAKGAADTRTSKGIVPSAHYVEGKLQGTEKGKETLVAPVTAKEETPKNGHGKLEKKAIDGKESCR